MLTVTNMHIIGYLFQQLARQLIEFDVVILKETCYTRCILKNLTYNNDDNKNDDDDDEIVSA